MIISFDCVGGVVVNISEFSLCGVLDEALPQDGVVFHCEVFVCASKNILLFTIVRELESSTVATFARGCVLKRICCPHIHS